MKKEELLRIRPELAESVKVKLIIDSSEVEKIKTTLSTKFNVNIHVVKNIIQNESYFNHFLVCAKENMNFDIFEIIEDRIKFTRSYNLSNIAYSMLEVYKDEIDILSEIERNRYLKILEITSFNYQLKESENSTFKVMMDDTEYTYLKNDLLNFINSGYENIKAFLETNKDKNKFMYALKIFLNTENLSKKTILSHELNESINLILTDNTIDIFSINKLKKSDYDYIKNAKVDQKLKEKILSGTENLSTSLEKAIYIYIHMCYIFSYDERYHAKGDEKSERSKMSNLQNITSENLDLICYEYSTIFAHLLHELGLKFEVVGKKDHYTERAHELIKFKIGHLIIKVDPINSLFKSDLLLSKLFLDLEGIKLENTNELSQLEFMTALNKMYELIKERYKENINKTNYEQIQNEDYSNLELNERYSLLLNELSKQNLSKIELGGYLNILKKLFFTDKEKNDDIIIGIVKNNSFEKTILEIIVYYNGMYFVYGNGKDTAKIITQQELFELFDKNIYSYINHYNKIFHKSNNPRKQ